MFALILSEYLYFFMKEKKTAKLLMFYQIVFIGANVYSNKFLT